MNSSILKEAPCPERVSELIFNLDLKRNTDIRFIAKDPTNVVPSRRSFGNQLNYSAMHSFYKDYINPNPEYVLPYQGWSESMVTSALSAN